MALYPPIVASSMPAFDINQGVKIYFTLSSYNSAKKDQIKKVHLTCRRQSSNVNVLIGTEIKTYDFNDILNEERTKEDISLNRYFVILTTSDVNFQTEVPYKIQIRLSTSLETSVNSFTKEINSHSQWSTVCIIKPIIPPKFYIDEFTTQDDESNTVKEDDQNFHFSNLADFIGIYQQQDGAIEKLKQWRLRLLEDSYIEQMQQNIENYVLADSDWIFVSANNYTLNDENLSLEASLAYQLQNGQSYKLFFEILTRNDYYNSLLYSFTCSSAVNIPLEGQLNLIKNEEDGYVKLIFTSQEIEPGNCVIRRTDSKSNFQKWEDLKNFHVNDGNWNISYYDFTLESGLLYKYLIQKRDTRGRRGTPVYSQVVMVEWQHPFLLEATGNGDLIGTKQLKLKYDFQISSYKTNISESKTDTIGSKYPFIRRNGNMYYRSFPITGTITGYMDNANLLTNENELYDNQNSTYKSYQGDYSEYNENYFSHKYDYTYERKFREKVEQFLYNANPKLYKSTQEGNIFIKLMQISQTPKNELGRLVYSFTATAYEIDKATIDIFNKYNLISIGEYDPQATISDFYMGQISSFIYIDDPFSEQGKLKWIPFEAGKDIIGTVPAAAPNSIGSKLNFEKPYNGLITKAISINWLRLSIESDPYLIIQDTSFTLEDGSQPGFRPFQYGKDEKKVITKPINYPLYQLESTYNSQNVYLGTLFYIGRAGSLKSLIISPPNDVYELKDKKFNIENGYQIIPAKNTYMSIEVRANISKIEDTTDDPKNIRIDSINGQLIGTFSEQTELISRIKYKYYYSYQQNNNNNNNTNSKVQKYVNSVNSVLVDAQPGTIVKLQTEDIMNHIASDQASYIVNETGQLNFTSGSERVGIYSLKIYGINIQLKYNGRYCGNTKENNKSYYHGDYIVFKQNNENVIEYFYKDKWVRGVLHDWEENQNQSYEILGDPSVDIPCPVDALIFYNVNVRRDYY